MSDVILKGRGKQELRLDDSGNLLFYNDSTTFSITTNDESEGTVEMVSDKIHLYTRNSTSEEDFSIVYGEKLVDILKFILRTLKTHKHPPNAPPLPTFFPEADRIIENIEDILNKSVTTK